MRPHYIPDKNSCQFRLVQNVKSRTVKSTVRSLAPVQHGTITELVI